MRIGVSVAAVPRKPVFIYDGECAFCGRWVARWCQATEDRVEFQAAPDSRFPEISAEDYRRSSVFVDTDGAIYTGAEAVFRMFAHAHGQSWWIWAHRHVRGFEPISELVYRLVATNRFILSRVLPGPVAGHAGARALFLRLLGLVYLCAFGSFALQVRGLIGSEGILPVGDLMQAAAQQLTGSSRWFQLPTFCWISASDGFLLAQCGAGLLLALLLIAGLLPGFATPLLWALWLSLTSVGRDFMNFQWENLLLETGFLAIFIAPISLTLRSAQQPSLLTIFLFRWLLFRLMFMSGMVKLFSGDETWRNLTALNYHFETQPLPTLIGYYAHQFPLWLLKAQTLLLFIIEIGFAFLVFAPRKLRLAACAGFIVLQIGIAITGNYGYFNLLSAVLCVLLLDDRILRAGSSGPVRPLRAWRNGLLIARSFVFALAAFAIFTLSLVQMIASLGSKREWPKPILALYVLAEPFRSVNGYGLFAVMTRTRPEIVVQGSNDGETWKDYTFKYKPGDLKRGPGFVAPHQPRLDWQMWFAALGSIERNRWFGNFCVRLLQGSPAVLELLATNPFPDKPPKFVRALVYDYEFTTLKARRETGEYWTRTNERIYLPPISFQKEADKAKPAPE